MGNRPRLRSFKTKSTHLLRRRSKPWLRMFHSFAKCLAYHLVCLFIMKVLMRKTLESASQARNAANLTTNGRQCLLHLLMFIASSVNVSLAVKKCAKRLAMEESDVRGCAQQRVPYPMQCRRVKSATIFVSP